MKTLTLMLLVLATMPIGCTPSPGRFCREDDRNSCWDADFGAKTMTIVFPNGERGYKELPLSQGQGDFDYSLEAGNGSQVQVKILDRNTIGIRNSEAKPPVFDRFVRR